MTAQPAPTVTREEVERLVRREFPPDRAPEALAALEEYGGEPWQREAHRVRAAALKLAAGSLQDLRAHIEVARRDYRDVLAAAEYPGYCRRTPGLGPLPAGEEQRVIDSDRKQYRDWFER